MEAKKINIAAGASAKTRTERCAVCGKTVASVEGFSEIRHNGRLVHNACTNRTGRLLFLEAAAQRKNRLGHR
jgi:hypothetical protein